MGARKTGQPCRCGCGVPTRSHRTEFLPGHHWRVIPQEPGRHLVPVRIRERSLCECGCGEPVKYLGSKFRAGHHTRTDEWKAQRAKGEWRRCMGAGCGKRFWIEPSNETGRRTCSHACYGASRRSPPWNKVQVRLNQHLAEAGKTLSSLGREIGVPPGTLRSWFQHKGSPTSRRNLQLIAEVLHISLEDAVREAGGTADEQRLEAARRGRERRPQRPTEATRAKMSAAGRGKRKSPEHIAHVQAARRASGGMARSNAARLAVAQSTEWRASQSLRLYLRWHGSPSLEELRAWAMQTAGHLDVCIGEVIAWWNPQLAKRGLPRMGGRPNDVQRCRVLRDWIATRGQPTGYGYWYLAPEGPGWRRDHKVRCPTLRAASLVSRDDAKTSSQILSPGGALEQVSH